MNRNILITVLLTFIANVFPSDEWRIMAPPWLQTKSQYDSPPFYHWEKQNIGYRINSSPAGVSQQRIHDAFDEWDDLSENINFVSGSDVTIISYNGEPIDWFGATSYPSKNETTGKIISVLVQLNISQFHYYPPVKFFPIQWTDGTEDVDFNRPSGATQYVDLQNTMTHEVGHVLGIDHHSTGTGEPTMATREQCPDFNTTLKRRDLEDDDRFAFEFLYAIKSGTMKINQTWRDATHTTTGAISLLSGTTLTIMPGVTVNFYGDLTVSSGVTLYVDNWDQTGDIILKFDGKVDVYGTIAAYYADFKEISSGSFDGIYVQSDADAEIMYCNIED